MNINNTLNLKCNDFTPEQLAEQKREIGVYLDAMGQTDPVARAYGEGYFANFRDTIVKQVTASLVRQVNDSNTP